MPGESLPTMDLTYDDFEFDESPGSDSSFVTPADTPAGNEKKNPRLPSFSGL